MIIAGKDKEKNNLQFPNSSICWRKRDLQYNLPRRVRVIDNRDAMHKRGWTYFSVTGEFNGSQVGGKGRMPFVYKQSVENYPWLRVQVGRQEIIDTAFAGFGRPWMGLHTIDIVRRDAAQRQIPFDTKLSLDGRKSEVTLKNGTERIIYTIDMKADVVEKITFTGEKDGKLQFEYMQKIDDIDNDFISPRISDNDEQKGRLFFENF